MARGHMVGSIATTKYMYSTDIAGDSRYNTPLEIPRPVVHVHMYIHVIDICMYKRQAIVG